MSVINRIRILGAITLIGMPFLAWIISLIFDLDFCLSKWILPENSTIQLVLGIGYGLLVAIIASWITERPFMESVRTKYEGLFKRMTLTWFDVFFISICAGIGEEILFRFALQGLIGIWLAALVFVAVHGYLNPKDWRISVYGAFMTIAAAGFGYLRVEIGLLSAITAHAVVDIYLLSQIRLDQKKTTFEI